MKYSGVIESKLRIIEQKLAEIESSMMQNAAERALQVSVEAMTDDILNTFKEKLYECDMHVDKINTSKLNIHDTYPHRIKLYRSIGVQIFKTARHAG